MPVTYSSADAIADIPGATNAALKQRINALVKAYASIQAERKAIIDEQEKRDKIVKAKIRIGTPLTADEKTLWHAAVDAS